MASIDRLGAACHVGVAARRLAVGMVLVAGLAAHAQTPAPDVTAGKTLALTLCTPCHVVAPDQSLPPILVDPAPRFDTIANRKDISAASLRQFLATTHTTVANPLAMPNPQLVAYQFEPLIAYILSWRGKPWTPQPASRTGSRSPEDDALYQRVMKDSREPAPRRLDAPQ